MASKIKTVSVYGFEGHDIDRAQAKKHAIDKIESLTRGYWTPSAVYWGLLALAYTWLDRREREQEEKFLEK